MHIMHQQAITQNGAGSPMSNQTEKRPGGRRAYLNDFHQTLSGEFVYEGALYTFEGTPRQRRMLYLRLAALGLVMSAAGVVCGCIYAPGTLNCFYILIPYIISLMASVSLLWGLARLAWAGSPLRAYIYQATMDQFPVRTTLAAITSGAAIVGEVVYVCLHGAGELAAGMAVFLLCQGLVLAGALLWRRLTENSCWVKSEGPKPQE